MNGGKGCVINITGVMSNEIVKCYTCARELAANFPDRVSDVKYTTLFNTQWDLYIKNL